MDRVNLLLRLSTDLGVVPLSSLQSASKIYSNSNNNKMYSNNNYRIHNSSKEQQLFKISTILGSLSRQV